MTPFNAASAASILLIKKSQVTVTRSLHRASSQITFACISEVGGDFFMLKLGLYISLAAEATRREHHCSCEATDSTAGRSRTQNADCHHRGQSGDLQGTRSICVAMRDGIALGLN